MLYSLLQPALVVNRLSRSSRRISKSNAKILPVFPTKADKWDVLLPGAAHASMICAPFGGLQTCAGKHDALSYAI